MNIGGSSGYNEGDYLTGI